MPIKEEHPAINLPKSNIELWRYMDIPSFISLLANEALIFVRADLFEDKFEGTLPKVTNENVTNWARTQIKQGKLHKGYWNLGNIISNEDKKTVYLNCWCKENHQMVHMWKIYSKENGIAIQTTYEDLKNSITSDEIVYPSEINYIDFQKDIVDHQNGLSMFSIKRREYKSESEFRLILSFPRIIEDQLLQYKTHEEIRPFRNTLYQKTQTIKISVNLSKLIKTVNLSPYAPKWYYEVIRSILDKYNLGNVNISTSDL
ncbi:MAG: hypothetical protein GX159_04505 [Flavobacteriaceae bacterium]|nr:hypothetical protein [Flavobacteriaceae bacterium]